MILAVQAVLGLAMFLLHRFPMDPRFDVPQAAPVSGALLIAGLALALTAMVTLGRSFQAHPRPRDDASLVTRGIYRWLRHPMYTALVFICLGLAIDAASLFAALAAVANVTFYVVKSRYEERLLRERYQGYAAYQQRSWGVIPFTGRRPSPTAGSR